MINNSKKIKINKVSNMSKMSGNGSITSMMFLLNISLSKHMGDGKEKLGRGPYAISTAILSMYTGFQHPGTKYMLAPGHRKLTFLCGFSCGFAKLSI